MIDDDGWIVSMVVVVTGRPFLGWMDGYVECIDRILKYY